MKKSVSGVVAEKILKVIGAKNMYQNPNFMKLQEKINSLPTIVPPGQRVFWKKFKLGSFHYFATKRKSENILIYFHGGAFVSGPNIFHWNFLKRLRRRTNFQIYFPMYPKAPAHNFKEAYDFIFEFYKEVCAKNPEANFVFMGDSAGGNIALSFAQQVKAKNLKQPSKVILFSPCLDLTLSNPQIDEIDKQDIDPMLSKPSLKSAYEKWANGEDLKNPVLSPFYGDCHNIGEITLFIGTQEVLLPENQDFKEKCEAEGIKINFTKKDLMNHVYVLQPIKEGRQETRALIKTLNKKEKQ
ncbi:MAG: alpha/beta hydrolase fold domain-containing protein [Christensenellales bacterium]|jgi:acetyl esterase/lipase